MNESVYALKGFSKAFGLNTIAVFNRVSYDEFKKYYPYGSGNKKKNESENTNHIEDSNEADIIDAYAHVVNPKRSTSGSAGYDFFSPYDISLLPGESILIPTGIRCYIEPGWFLSLHPRSGLGSKYFLRLANTTGIIDSDYYFSDNEGHILAKIRNEGDKQLNICQGQAFMQGIFVQHGVTYDDNTTAIRNGGFGSTDKGVKS